VGNRLSKIYTRTGDDGTTGLGNGDRVPKDSRRVEAYGTVDELNSAVGLIVASGCPDDIAALLAHIQQDLFNLGGELCIPGTQLIESAAVDQLETELDKLNADLPELKDFVLPGGSRTAAACHLARAICRRAERRVFSLSQETDVSTTALQYLNRLSDLLFVMARSLNRQAEHAEVLWNGSNRSRSAD
jgi:cob(I)alamin adenosyltransferase